MKRIQRSVTGVLLTTAVMCLVSVLQVSAQKDDRARLVTLLQQKLIYSKYALSVDDEGIVDSLGRRTIRWAEVTEIEDGSRTPNRFIKLRCPSTAEIIWFEHLSYKVDSSDMDAIVGAVRGLVRMSNTGSRTDIKSEPDAGKNSGANGSNSSAGSGRGGVLIISDEAHKKRVAAQKEQESAIAKQTEKQAADLSRNQADAAVRDASAKARAERRRKAALIKCHGSLIAAGKAKASCQ